MPEQGSGLPPAGWYPEAGGTARLRWWDGAGWTDQTRVPELPVPVPAAPPTPDAPLTRRQLREQVGPLTLGGTDQPDPSQTLVMEQPAAPAAPELELSSAERMRRAAGYAPRDDWAPAAVYLPASEPPSGSVQSFSGWLFAVSPLWVGGASLLVRLFMPFLNAATTPLASLIIAVLLTFGLARTDGKALRANGYRAPSPGWVLVPLVYFILRVVRAGRRSVPMLVTWIVLQTVLVLIAVSVGVAASTALHAANQRAQQQTQNTQTQGEAPSSGDTSSVVLTDEERAYLLTTDGMVESLRYSFSKEHTIGDVECQPFPSTAADSRTTCLLEADGALFDVQLRVSPEYDDAAFVVVSITPHGQPAGGATQT